MSDRDLFEVFNASANLHGGWLVLVRLLSSHVAWVTLTVLALVLVAGPSPVRRAMARMVYGAVLAGLLALTIAVLFPQPRPGDLSLGHQYLHPWLSSGFPSLHVTVLWSLALGALTLRPARLRLGTALLPLGLIVGWARIYLGAQFPSDVLAALPVAAVAVGLVYLLRRPIDVEITVPLMRAIDRLGQRWRGMR